MTWNKCLTLTVIFLAVIGTAFGNTLWKMNQMAEQDCSSILYQEMGNLSEEVPVMNEGKTEGTLYGIVRLEGLPDFCQAIALDGKMGISGQEDTVFWNMEEIKAMTCRLAFFLACCSAVYFIVLFRYMKKESVEKQKRLDMINYVYDVEKILFAAHQKKENIELALERIAKMTKAEAAFFKVYENRGKEQLYLWCCEKDKEEIIGSRLEEYRFFLPYFVEGKDYLIQYNVKTGKRQKTEKCRTLHEGGLSSVMAVGVRNIEGELIGVLGAVNMRHYWKTADLLENVTLGFSTFYNNMRSFSIIKEMGETDLLTGIRNRNSYQKRIAEYPGKYTSSLACVYADANGLHELNNSQGHEAGDRMLQCVAGCMKEKFGLEDTYRVGGDEFIAFVIDGKEEEILQKVKEIETDLEAEGYYISIGVKWGRGVASINDLVRKAEQAMYEAKRRYYEQEGRDRRVRCSRAD